MLVEFEPGHVPGFAFFTMQDELSEMLGRQVDLNTLGFLSPYFRDEVLSEAEEYYPWRETINLRNRLIHGYDTVDYEVVQQIIDGDLPPLIA